MRLQKQLMLLNPLAAAAYGIWFIVQPDGYLRLIEGMPPPVPVSTEGAYVMLGAALLALAYVLWEMRARSNLRSVSRDMIVFGMTWLIVGTGLIFSHVVYPDPERIGLMPIIQGAAFKITGIVFMVMRAPEGSAEDRAERRAAAPRPMREAR